MKRFLLLLSVLIGLVGCDHIPRKIYRVRTEDGKIIELLCPAVDPYRSTLTYLIDGDCVVVNSD